MEFVQLLFTDKTISCSRESGDLASHRRQSLAPTASTAKLKMLRRANSTDSNSIPLSPTAKKKTGSRMGFTRAKKNLKALFGRRSVSINEEDGVDVEHPVSNELSPPATQEHHLKVSRLHRQEACAVCNRHLSGFITQAYKCSQCKLCFHKECSSFAKSLPCSPSSPIRSPTRFGSPRRAWDIVSKPRPSMANETASSYSRSFNLNKTKQQTDPGNMIVESTEDLRQFSVFIFKKQMNLDQKKSKRDTVVDALFKKSLREFHMELIGYEAVLNEERAVLKYRDLITTFEGVLTKVCKEEKVSFPTTLGVNAFRKSGSLAQVRSIRRIIETAPDLDSVSLEDVQVHVLTTLVKAFLREMPEPLITFDLYENFLNVSEVDDGIERGRCLAVMIDLLPKTNRGLLDRLMFHLARVAHQEAVNKMGPSNLALIFGPCILRRQDNVHAQEQLNDVSRQAICVQTLIEEKLRQYKATLINIVELEDASQKVSANLRRIEEHQQLDEAVENIGTAKQLFEEQLDFLGRQKYVSIVQTAANVVNFIRFRERLLQELPPLAPVASSEDLSSSDEHSSGITREEYAIDMDAPPVFGVLYHACKYRAPPPKGRRPPSRFQRSPAVVFYTPLPD
ncbi:unnamed protein product [Haemonchus placei]|uniref:Rho-GAP domain-containing protein n=1 Tax=Haemonchus placei TaxID=6290 RepID=A0A0N4WVG8_HAEPC|nr:unnamed protein product [Haemonchus placei]